MRDNQISGNVMDSIATAVRKSYIAILCLNEAYFNDESCKQGKNLLCWNSTKMNVEEAQDLAIKQIECIPCLMEESFQLRGWLQFIVGPNRRVMFWTSILFREKMTNLIREITHHEKRQRMNPRGNEPDSPPMSPLNSRLLTRGEFDQMIETFREWVQQNRDILRLTDPTQAQRLASKLLESLSSGENFERQTKEEFLENLAKLINQPLRSERNYIRVLHVVLDFLFRVVIFFLMIWALQTLFKPWHSNFFSFHYFDKKKKRDEKSNEDRSNVSPRLETNSSGVVRFSFDDVSLFFFDFHA